MGIRIEKRPDARLSYGREICIYAAGPAVNLLVAALFFPYPGDTAGTSLLGILIFFPSVSLDGGQILRCFLQNKIEISRADRFQRLVSFFVRRDVVLAAAVFWKSGYNASLLVTTGYLLWLLLLETVRFNKGSAKWIRACGEGLRGESAFSAKWEA